MAELFDSLQCSDETKRRVRACFLACRRIPTVCLEHNVVGDMLVAVSVGDAKMCATIAGYIQKQIEAEDAAELASPIQ